ncbi:MAG TPA: hypothetical protein VF339_06160 [Gammaproteobacteria bacterium]
MISLFARPKETPLNLLKLPTYAVAQNESDTLAAKREAQLKWMRENGMSYLGDPLKIAELRAKRRPELRTIRLVEHAAKDDRETPGTAPSR